LRGRFGSGSAYHVTDGIDVRDPRWEELIDREHAFLRSGEPRSRQIEIFGVGLPAQRHQQLLALEREVVFQVHDDMGGAVPSNLQYVLFS